jgi:hypothetical protein
MSPRREASSEDSTPDTSSPVADLALALQELLRLQQRRPPAGMQLDTRFQLPKFVGQMHGETVDSWICSLSTYFKTSPEMEETTKLQIASLQLEGIAQTWWDTHLTNAELIVELDNPPSTNDRITSWEHFCQALRERFYPPGYLQNLLEKWLQLWQLSNQSVQAYIDVFYKLRLQLQINEPDQVLIIKFNSGLVLPLRREVDLFDSPSLDKAFLRALAVERKIAPCPRFSTYRTSTTHPSNPPRQTPSASSSTSKPAGWCTFHKTNSHNSSDCRALKNIHTNKTLMAEITTTDSPDLTETISLDNPTKFDPSLILMTQPASGRTNIPLFTHNCQIKTKLATLILDNGSQKNLISQDLVQHLQLPTSPHPDPYQLGWVQKGGRAS